MHPEGVHMHTPTGYAFRNVNTPPKGVCMNTPLGYSYPSGGPKGLPGGVTYLKKKKYMCGQVHTRDEGGHARNLGQN